MYFKYYKLPRVFLEAGSLKNPINEWVGKWKRKIEWTVFAIFSKAYWAKPKKACRKSKNATLSPTEQITVKTFLCTWFLWKVQRYKYGHSDKSIFLGQRMAGCRNTRNRAVLLISVRFFLPQQMILVDSLSFMVKRILITIICNSRPN